MIRLSNITCYELMVTELQHNMYDDDIVEDTNCWDSDIDDDDRMTMKEYLRDYHGR